MLATETPGDSKPSKKRREESGIFLESRAPRRGAVPGLSEPGICVPMRQARCYSHSAFDGFTTLFRVAGCAGPSTSETRECRSLIWPLTMKCTNILTIKTNLRTSGTNRTRLHLIRRLEFPHSVENWPSTEPESFTILAPVSYQRTNKYSSGKASEE